MKKLLIISLVLILTTSAVAQWNGVKPMLGVPIDKAHPLGDPVAAWFLLESRGPTVFDLSGNENTGTFNGTGIVWNSGRYGPTTEHTDTANSFIDCGNSKVFDVTNITIVTSIRPDVTSSSLTSGDGIIDKRSSGVGTTPFRLINNPIADSIRFRFELVGEAAQNLDAITDLQTGQSYHVVVTYDGTDAKVYIDSILENTVNTPGALDTNTDNLYIGTLGDGSSLQFDGQIDYILIYNRALTASEIALLYREPFGMFVKDDIVLMVASIPAPTGGQVIMIQMSMLTPLIIFASIGLMKGRKIE